MIALKIEHLASYIHIAVQEKAMEIDFLKDHWPYNKDDLVRLLDLSFNWKAVNEDEREVIMIGGDIHCGVRSIIRDNETDFKNNGVKGLRITSFAE